MEKPARSKGKIFSFIPGATSVSFHNPPISPGPEKRPENWNKFKANPGKGFSGPIISIIPAEARRKSRSGSFDVTEPTSPKVSCMGQIKHKHKKLKNKKKNTVKSKSLPSPRDFYKLESSPGEAKKKPSSAIRRIFGIRRSDHSDVPDREEEAVQVQGKATSLGQMKRFTSGRNSLANFDWTAHMPAASDDRNYHSDEERGGGGESDEDGVIIPHSAPIMVVGGGVAFGGKERS
ncbi:uncharacterized protein At1g76070-like [Macadamia integrifolia]|uniref:uncharacterized protein At1g76070-like n=1 Tax=Macadamia integrifolia TaxID=60698 RepID=UPI001C501380|nr:uncharacterized protein At1g76070-like [Macadamia integrifolia]